MKKSDTILGIVISVIIAITMSCITIHTIWWIISAALIIYVTAPCWIMLLNMCSHNKRFPKDVKMIKCIQCLIFAMAIIYSVILFIIIDNVTPLYKLCLTIVCLFSVTELFLIISNNFKK